jgi:hypothetical protein
MEIPYICDGHIEFFPTFPMEIFDHFEVFRLYSLFQKMKITKISKLFDVLFSNEVNAQMLLIYILTSLSGYPVTRKRLVYGKKR